MIARKRPVGRPRLPPHEQRVRYMVTLHPDVVRTLREAGGGNLSRGIGIAAGRARQPE